MSEFCQFIQDPGYPQDLVLHLEQITAWCLEEMVAHTQEARCIDAFIHTVWGSLAEDPASAKPLPTWGPDFVSPRAEYPCLLIFFCRLPACPLRPAPLGFCLPG